MSPAEHPDWRGLAEGNFGLAKYLAARYRRDRLHFDDRLDAAIQGLTAASMGYDPDRGVPFAPYAAGIIRRHIDEELWNNRAVRIPVHASKKSGRARRSPEVLRAVDRALATVSLDAMPREPMTPDPDMDAEDPAVELARIIAGLPMSRGRSVLEGRAAGRTLADIGRDFGLCRESVRLIERDAIARLRAEHGGDPTR